MDIFNEITKLPQYYYEWESGCAIWGREYYNKEMEGTGVLSRIRNIWTELAAYYKMDGDKEILTDDEKAEYAKEVDNMRIYCEKEELSDEDFDRDALINRIDTLSEEDKKEIEWQIDMYKRGRRYYGQYVRNK